MTTRGRKPGFQMGEEHRVKIKNSNILNALIEHVEGTREMSATQVSAGLGLLRKVMPDLAQTDVNHTVKHDVRDYTREELVAFLADHKDGGEGPSASDGSGSEPDRVH